MTNVEKVTDFINKAQTYYLATVDGDQPKCRPLGFILEDNGKIYFGVGKHKSVYRQMQSNSKVEICACIGMEFLRYYGKSVFTNDKKVKEKAFGAMPALRDLYNAQTGKELGIFFLEDATAEFYGAEGIETSFSI